MRAVAVGLHHTSSDSGRRPGGSLTLDLQPGGRAHGAGGLKQPAHVGRARAQSRGDMGVSAPDTGRLSVVAPTSEGLADLPPEPRVPWCVPGRQSAPCCTGCTGCCAVKVTARGGGGRGRAQTLWAPRCQPGAWLGVRWEFLEGLGGGWPPVPTARLVQAPAGVRGARLSCQSIACGVCTEPAHVEGWGLSSGSGDLRLVVALAYPSYY